MGGVAIGLVLLGQLLGSTGSVLATERDVAPAPDPPPAETAQVSAAPPSTSPAADAVALRWTAPEGCPDEAAVRGALASYLGTQTTVEAAASVQATATVSPHDGGGFRLALRTETTSGVTTRETVADDCFVFVEATALVVAIAVDPSSVVGRSESTPDSPEPEPESPPPPEASAPPQPEPAQPTPGRDSERAPMQGEQPLPALAAAPVTAPVVALRVGGGVDVGALPGAAGGLRLAAAWLGPRWRAELRGEYWFPRTAVAEPGLGARVSLWSLGARGCYVPRVAAVPLEFPVCGGAGAGAMRGDPVGDRVVAPQTSRRPWFEVDASAGLAWVPRRYLALVVQAELVVPVLRAGFRVGDVEVHRAGVIGGRGLAGIEVRFP
ncbi:MAG: hypothetical protein K0V04_32595 [Deltaproteobacteria bacterium]|nr:hypothetical protein [Deltaproteobacteria bacterium]